MNALERNIEALNISGLLSAAVRFPLNEETWSEVLSLERMESFAQWIDAEEEDAQFGMPNPFMRALNEVHMMLVNPPAVAWAFDQITASSIQAFLTFEPHYLILGPDSPALRLRSRNLDSLFASQSNVGIDAWLGLASGSTITPNFEGAFFRLQTGTPALSDYRARDFLAELTDFTIATLESPLAADITSALAHKTLDDDAQQDAQMAAHDARAFANRELSADTPRVMIADDGTVMLQWRGPDRGVLLVFTGDGTASYAIKRVGGSYATNREEFSLKDKLPAKVRSAIDDIVGRK